MSQSITETPPKPVPVTIYDASGRDRILITAWLVMFRELRESRELIIRLVLRNFSAQFRQSFLGYLWIILPPVATTVVFALLRQANLLNVPLAEGAMPYALFSLIGLTIWGGFTQFTTAATNSITSGGNLVARVYFPREVLVLSSIGNALINLIIRFGVILLTFVAFSYMPSWKIIFVPILLLPMVALAVGLGMFFAPVNTMMNDMSRVLEFVFQFGMFIVPCVFPTPDLMTATTYWERALYWIHIVNPVTHFINVSRDLIHTGVFHFSIGYQVSTILGFLILALGWRFFHICEPLLAERL